MNQGTTTTANNQQQEPPRCTQCGSAVEFVGNEDYAEDGNKYLYHCSNCGAELEVYEPLDEDKPQFNFWKNDNTQICKSKDAAEIPGQSREQTREAGPRIHEKE